MRLKDRGPQVQGRNVGALVLVRIGEAGTDGHGDWENTYSAS